MTGDEPIDLYDIIRQRYEWASTVITSNRGLEEWAPLFNDQLLANAATDRLLHHVNVIEVTGASYRNPPLSPKKKGSPDHLVGEMGKDMALVSLYSTAA